MKPGRTLAVLASMAIVLSLSVIALAAPPKVDVDSVPRVDESTDLDVSNSRHNMSRTDGEHVGNTATDQVCVFCHTPHFSNTDAVDMPLWNRNLSAATYTPYSSSTMDTTPGQPDGNSIACLGCHDGTVAFDSLVNAPGPKGVNGYTMNGTPNATFTNNAAFALGWTFNDDGVLPLGVSPTMITLSSLDGGVGPSNRVRYLIGTDLSNDHPISMTYPTAAEDPAFNQPPGTPGSPREFTNGIETFAADKVQCASCHEVHLGDTQATAKGLRMFLRVSNQESAMCLTCHIK